MKIRDEVRRLVSAGALVCVSLVAPCGSLQVDFGETTGPVKPVNGVGQGPLLGWDNTKMFSYLKNARIRGTAAAEVRCGNDGRAARRRVGDGGHRRPRLRCDSPRQCDEGLVQRADRLWEVEIHALPRHRPDARLRTVSL